MTQESMKPPGFDQLHPGLGKAKNGVCYHLGWQHKEIDECADHAPTIGQLLALEPARGSQR